MRDPVPEVQFRDEEAGTRIVLHARHARRNDSVMYSDTLTLRLMSLSNACSQQKLDFEKLLHEKGKQYCSSYPKVSSDWLTECEGSRGFQTNNIVHMVSRSFRLVHNFRACGGSAGFKRCEDFKRCKGFKRCEDFKRCKGFKRCEGLRGLQGFQALRGFQLVDHQTA